MILNITGNSGCNLTIIDSNLIRKMSGNKKYNSRLIVQMKKQMNFDSPILKKPRVVNFGYEGDLFFFDMEYINGKSFSQYCVENNFSEIENIMNLLLPKQNQKSKNISEDLFSKCKTLDNFPLHVLQEVSWDVPDSECHGDFTFENIIIYRDEIYLIDFLDSFVNTSIIDESKFMQDTYCGWSFRNTENIPLHKLLMMNEILESKQKYILLLVHLYRILPYSNEKTKGWVKCQIKRVMEKIKNI